MSLEIEGVVIHLLEPKSGTSAAGKEWKSSGFVILTGDTYPKPAAFSGMGKVVEHIERLQVGQKIKVHFNPESREWEGRWFTDNKAWRIDVTDGSAAPAPATSMESMHDLPPVEFGSAVTDEDLPF